MKIVKPKAELMEHNTDIYSFIEKVGRVCYKSEDKITEGSANKFVIGLNNAGHRAMLEHEYLYFNFPNYNDIIHFISGFLVPDSHSYNLAKYLNISEQYISGSVRAWVEFFEEVHKLSKKFVLGMGMYKQMYCELHDAYPDLFTNKEMLGFNDEDRETLSLEKITLVSRERFLEQKEPSYVYYNLLPHTIKLTVDRAVANEVVRHRPASFAQTSTRYLNYSNEKFDEQITVIDPCFFSRNTMHHEVWKKCCQNCEDTYMNMLKNSASPEEARTILPNSLMTELIVTATEAEWQHIINLRYHGTTGRPHPQMVEVMNEVFEILKKESGGRIQ